MAPVYDRAMLIEALRQATLELAKSHSNLTKSAALRARIVGLLETLEERSSIARRGEYGGAPAPSFRAIDAGEGPPSSLRTAI
jgi:hypothetical protein